MNHTSETRAVRLSSLFACAFLALSSAALAQQSPSAGEPPPPPPAHPMEDEPSDELKFRSAPEADEDFEYSPGETADSPLYEIEEAASARAGMISVPGLTPMVESWRTGLDDLYKDTGLRFAFAYTMLFQQATGSGSDRNGFSGDMDFMADWTLVGRGTANTGRLIATAEYRHQIGLDPPNFLRDEIGSLQRTTGGFDDRGWAVRDVHYTQRFFDGRLRVLAGRADASDYVGGHRLQGINNSFSNRAFSADSTTAYPSGHVTALGVSVRPIDQFYVTAGASNAYGRSTINDMQYLDEGKFFTFGEAGFTPVIPNLGWGRYAVMLWHMADRDLLDLPSDNGFTVVAEQDFGDRILAFARYGWADEGVLTGIKQSGQIGVGFRGLLGSPLNMTGVGFGVSDPSASDLDPESVLEVFHRFQLTSHTQFSLGFQSIFEPSNSDDDFVGVLTCRLRIAF